MTKAKGEPLFDVVDNFNHSLKQARLSRGEPVEGFERARYELYGRAEELGRQAREYGAQAGQWVSEHSEEVRKGGKYALGAVVAGTAAALAFRLLRERNPEPTDAGGSRGVAEAESPAAPEKDDAAAV